MTQTVLAVGAAGRNAGLVVPALARRGMQVRGLIRKADQADAVRRAGAADVAVGDLADRASLDAALRGVTRVFYIAPVFAPDEAELGLNMVAAAKAAGVRRIVFSSVIHPVLSLVNHAAKVPVEDAILDSGLDYALLHPALFFQNYRAAWGDIVEEGALAEPWSAEIRFSRVDYRDVAEVAAIALTEDRLLGGTYELAAEGPRDRHEVAALIAEALGRPIRAERADPAAAAAAGTPMRAMFEHYDRVGLIGNPLILASILGRAPRTLQDFFRELAGKPSQPRKDIA